MHLADAFIQSHLQCIQAIHIVSMCVAIGSLVHCVMFSLVIVLSCDYQFCVLIGWFLSCVQSFTTSSYVIGRFSIPSTQSLEVVGSIPREHTY